MGTKSILVVEDDHNIRVTLRNLLEHEGYAVISAANGQDGLDLFKHIAPPSLVLLDLQMPIMDGLEFLAAKAAVPSIASIPVVVISAAPDAQRVIQGQVQGFVKKPIDHETLMGFVLRYCVTASP